MSNIHRGDDDGYHCPDKGNRFPLAVYGGTKKRPTCPGCGADLRKYYVRKKPSQVLEQPTPAPASGETTTAPPVPEPMSEEKADG